MASNATPATLSLLGTPSAPCGLTMLELGGAMRRRTLCAREIVEAHLERIERLAPVVNAFISVAVESARREADRLDEERARGIDRGPLHGIPVAIKDVFATQGLPTTGGSRIADKEPAPHDAEAVARLRRAGAIVLGKTNLNEFAFGVTGINPHFGTVRNPWDAERIAGGSSSGSAAAVAAGMSPVALGTDTGGSVRIPASFVGVVGYKPTYELVSRRGVLPLSWSLDHVGILARSVADARLLTRCLADGASVKPDGCVDLRDLRIGILEDLCVGLSPAVDAAWNDFLHRCAQWGVKLEALELRQADETLAASTAIMFAEAAVVHAKWLRACPELYDPAVRSRLVQGALIPATTYLRAQQIRRRLKERVMAAFERVDVIASPTQPEPAVLIREVAAETVARMVRHTRLAPLLGMPALSLTLPTSGLPIGLQLMAAIGHDDRLLALAEAIEMQLAGGARGHGRERKRSTTSH